MSEGCGGGLYRFNPRRTVRSYYPNGQNDGRNYETKGPGSPSSPGGYVTNRTDYVPETDTGKTTEPAPADANYDPSRTRDIFTLFGLSSRDVLAELDNLNGLDGRKKQKRKKAVWCG